MLTHFKISATMNAEKTGTVQTRTKSLFMYFQGEGRLGLGLGAQGLRGRDEGKIVTCRFRFIEPCK